MPLCGQKHINIYMYVQSVNIHLIQMNKVSCLNTNKHVKALTDTCCKIKVYNFEALI